MRSRVSRKIAAALAAAGAQLQRQRKHQIYRLPNGRTFTVSSSPSDWRAEHNALARLKRTTTEKENTHAQ